MARHEKWIREMMPLAVGLTLAPSSGGADEVLIFGDSLSKEYAIEFAGDGYPSTVKNWIEILDAERGAHFDTGSLGAYPDYRTLGYEYNWSIPGGRIKDFVDIVNGKTFLDEFIAQPVIRGQLQNEVERFVLFVGGNDADRVYGTAYNGGSLADFRAGFLADTTTVLDWVLAQNPLLEAVLVGVPHVGITPKVKGEYPPDPVMTGNVTAEMAILNAELEALAASRGVAFVDIFGLTLELLDPDPLVVQGLVFLNEGDVGGDLDYVWLAGELSDNFHPNTIGQAVVAHAIADAFNRHYGTGVRLLSTEEILEGLLGRDADLGFAAWLAAYGFAGAPSGDDPDCDGLSHLEEFGLGMDPRRPDGRGNQAPVLTLVPGAAGVEGSISYRPRLAEGSVHVEVIPQRSATLEVWSDAVEGTIMENPDGSLRAALSFTGPAGFQRLDVRLLTP